MKRIQVLAIFPTLLTLGNAVCGFTAIMLATQATFDKPDPLFYAGLLIFGAMLFDMLDGSVARLGIVRSTRVEASFPEAWQTLGVECHA